MDPKLDGRPEDTNVIVGDLEQGSKLLTSRGTFIVHEKSTKDLPNNRRFIWLALIDEGGYNDALKEHMKMNVLDSQFTQLEIEKLRKELEEIKKDNSWRSGGEDIEGGSF